MTSSSRRLVLSYVLIAIAGFRGLPAHAAGAADAEVHRLQSTWEAIKFGVPEGDAQTTKMSALGEDADAVAARFPDSPEVLIWDGIITSERASMAGAFSALGLAKRARDILEQAYKMAPARRLANCWSRPSNWLPRDWMPGIFMVISFTTRRNIPRPPRLSITR